MKCPNCGREIPEGHMYCDSCGKEINFVPDFEPEVENEINETLSGVADELNKEERLKEERKKAFKKKLLRIKKKLPLLLIPLGLVFVVLFIVCMFTLFSDKSAYHYLRKAESYRNMGQMDEAISYLIEGNENLSDNTEIIFRLSDYYLENGQTDEAVDTLRKIIDSGSFDKSIVTTAYESIISIYEQNEEYDKLSELLHTSDNETIAELKEKYVPEAPSMAVSGGEYEDSVVVDIISQNEDKDSQIYYTVNDGEPDENSIAYSGQIVLDTEGEYVIKAVCINKYGSSSKVVTEKYVVVKGVTSPPEIMEPSGEYNQNTMIVAVADAGCTIFYTTDGSDPTINSKQYVSPITMPVGTSHYKFIAIDKDGEESEIVERDYHLVFTRLVSTEQAVNNVVSTLVRLDYLLDNTGKVRGLDGHNEYIYNSVIEIAGAGEYYVIIENYVAYDGSVSPTGLLYAVNTHDGAVNRLGYDSSGKYTLITISNR
nr:chitobiase/beta-hexosaminidase C-terminal domain-containing protein [uncultured Butyrivibrio sp.]